MAADGFLGRRDFLKQAAGAAALGAGAHLAGSPVAAADGPPATPPAGKVRVGVIGCGNVSGAYLADLKARPCIELVSVCDIIVARAEAAAARHGVPHVYPHIDKMLAGTDFDLLVNITDMQAHYALSKAALAAGKHVWSEKPMAATVAEGRELLELAAAKGRRYWVAPTVVTSPQFRFMAEAIAAGKLGHVSSAHALYGHNGPGWSAFFYEKGGGSLCDLGVYNIATLTGLLGPAKAVMGMTAIVVPQRRAGGKLVRVEADDNAMLMIDHGNGTFSHVATGFTHFTEHHHRDTTRQDYTIDIVGSLGQMHLVGYDWGPHGVDLATRAKPEVTRHCTDPGGYTWQYGAG